MKKILIRGAGFVNKGAEALLLTACNEIKKRILDVEFWVEVAPHGQKLARHYNIHPLDEIKCGTGFSRILARGKVQKAIGLAPALIAPVVECFYKADFDKRSPHVDATIDVSGYAYFGAGTINILNVLSYMRRQSGPYFFLPQAWGPMTSRQSRFFLRQITRKAARVYSRDPLSSAFLQQCNCSGVREAPDIALAFNRIGNDRHVPEYLQTVMQLGRPLVGIAPNMRVYERSAGEGLQNQYISFLVKVCRFCIETLGASVVLISNEIHPESGVRDDQDLCEMLHEQMNSHDCVYQRQYYSAEMIRNIVGQLDLLIGSRFHTLIFALSQCVPVLALGWSHKYAELLKSFGMDGYAIGHERGYDFNEGVGRITEIWDLRQAKKSIIRQRLSSHLQAIDKLFDEVVSDIEGK